MEVAAGVHDILRSPLPAKGSLELTMDDSYLTKMLKGGRDASAGIGPRKCRSCNGFGVDLVGIDGLCDHCRRAGKSSIAASSATTAVTAVASGGKRSRVQFEDNENGDDEANDIAAPGPAAISSEPTAEDIARMLDEADKGEVPSLDINGVKRLLLSLERAITKNSLARAKHSDQPARFIESEVALDEELKRVRLLAAAPERYDVFVKSDRYDCR